MASLECGRQFGQNLRRCRRLADLSQEQVGFRADLHRTAIGLLERGGRIPRIDTLVKLAAALDVDPTELLEGITWEPAAPQSGYFKVPSQDAADEKRFNKPLS